MTLIFWLSLAFVAFTVAGYPLLVRARVRWGRRPPPPRIPWITSPRVAVVLCAHNEAGRISARLANLADTHHTADRLRIVVVDDASTDGTADAAEQAASGLAVPVLVVRRPLRKGKPAGLNAARLLVDEPIVVLTDVRQRFEPETIPALVAALADPNVGAVSGLLEIAGSAAGAGGGVGRYWRIERQLRADEAVLDSCIGVTGAVCALRRELWEEIPEDTLIDDVAIPMGIAARGYRIDFRPEARAYDPQPLDPERESVRKRRTLAGNFQLLARHPRWILPGGHRLWWAFFWHKIARLLVPAALLLVLTSSLALAPGRSFYAAAAAGQLCLYALAVAGLARPAWRAPWFALPAAFLFLQVQVIRGLLHFLRGNNASGWERSTQG